MPDKFATKRPDNIAVSEAYRESAGCSSRCLKQHLNTGDGLIVLMDLFIPTLHGYSEDDIAKVQKALNQKHRMTLGYANAAELIEAALAS